MIQAEPAADDFLLALIEPTQNPFDLRLTLMLRAFLGQRVAPMFLSTGKQLILARTEAIAMLELARNRPREVLHDRPARIRAEFVAACEVEFLDGPQQRHVAVAH